MRMCLAVAMVVCLGMAGPAWATPGHGTVGPGEAHTWEEDFNDNVDPQTGNPDDWQNSPKPYTVEDGMMTFTAANGWAEMRTLPKSFNNGTTVIDIVFASDPTKGPQSTDTGRGVGLWFDVGSEPNSLFGGNGITNGQIPMNVLLDWDGDYSQHNHDPLLGGTPLAPDAIHPHDSTGPLDLTHAAVEADHLVPAHPSGPTIKFAQGSVLANVSPIHVANTGTVSVNMVIAVMEGDAGARVDYTVTDDDNVVTTGFYIAQTEDFAFAPIAGKDIAVLNIAGSTGAIDYLKIANYPDNEIPSDDGDFDNDGDVDGADLLLWQRELGGAADLTLWENTYGNISATASVGAVPEPSSAALLGLMLAGLATRRRRRS